MFDVTDDFVLGLPLAQVVNRVVQKLQRVFDIALHQQEVINHEQLQRHKADTETPLEYTTGGLGTQECNIALHRLGTFEDRNIEVWRFVLAIGFQHAELAHRHQPVLATDAVEPVLRHTHTFMTLEVGGREWRAVLSQ